MTSLSTITKKHQITIPSNIVADLELRPKDKVLFERKENWIKILPLKEKSFLDLQGVIKSKKKTDFKKLRKQFEKDVARQAYR